MQGRSFGCSLIRTFEAYNKRMGAFLYRYGPLIARILVVPIFLYSSLKKFADLTHTAVYIASTFVQNGLVDPIHAAEPWWRYLGVLAGTVELAGVVLLLLGFRTRSAALSLIVYLLPVTFVFHGLGWMHAPDAMAANTQALSLFKNLAIMAALLQLATYGPGRPSVDVRA